MGNEADYIKMDRPMSCRNPWSSKCFNDPVWGLFICAENILCVFLVDIILLAFFIADSSFSIFRCRQTQKSLAFPQPLYKGSCGVKGGQPKLDSRFVLDVNVSDGTVMPSSTPFTKIWRMRNSGSVAWPQGVRLVWIGGDQFFSADSVEIEVGIFSLLLFSICLGINNSSDLLSFCGFINLSRFQSMACLLMVNLILQLIL
jgi:next-to-BRCA1 protein 1